MRLRFLAHYRARSSRDLYKAPQALWIQAAAQRWISAWPPTSSAAFRSGSRPATRSDVARAARRRARGCFARRLRSRRRSLRAGPLPHTANSTLPLLASGELVMRYRRARRRRARPAIAIAGATSGSCSSGRCAQAGGARQRASAGGNASGCCSWHQSRSRSSSGQASRCKHGANTWGGPLGRANRPRTCCSVRLVLRAAPVRARPARRPASAARTGREPVRGDARRRRLGRRRARSARSRAAPGDTAVWRARAARAERRAGRASASVRPGSRGSEPAGRDRERRRHRDRTRRPPRARCPAARARTRPRRGRSCRARRRRRARAARRALGSADTDASSASGA